MASLLYDEIYSRFYSRVEAYDFIEMNPSDADNYLVEWLRGAVAKPFVRRNYNSLILDNDVKELEYEIMHSIDEVSDESFTIEILSLGIEVVDEQEIIKNK